jgi:hypothetical protein
MTSTDKQSSRLHLPRRSIHSLIPCLPTRVVKPVLPIMATAECPARVHGKCKTSCLVEALLILDAQQTEMLVVARSQAG